MRDSRLKPCPFCGGEVEIQVADDEGNIHDEDYIDDPWSGLWYEISHDADKYKDCPIARFWGETFGHGYDSIETAIELWNTRTGE